MTIVLWYAIIVVGIVLLQRFSADVQRVETIPYSDFQVYLEQGRIDRQILVDRPDKKGRERISWLFLSARRGLLKTS
ncbi:MAG: ATP-dependent metallopeptidase FtsH/Yme1/Tma family protein [Desulfobulbaceae bacterium]